MEQKKALIRCANEMVQGRRKFLVGFTSMVYDEIVELSNYALKQRADTLWSADFQKAAECQRITGRCAMP